MEPVIQERFRERGICAPTRRRIARFSGMKTYVPKKGDIRRDWWVVDADGLTLGRLATEVASRLRGKHKPSFTPFLDTGDHVIVVNAEKVNLTGRKLEQKMYRRHSGYPGGLKEIAAGKLLASRPCRVVEAAVRGMLPKGPLGRQMRRKLKVYSGPSHPHAAQRPQTLEIPGAKRAS
jgi:large subunit ribosomal protein L13